MIADGEPININYSRTFGGESDDIEIEDVPTLLKGLEDKQHDVVWNAVGSLIENKAGFESAQRHPMYASMLGWHIHHDVFGEFPQDILTKQGTPGLSWRVKILPWIEQEELYDQFKLDEPWDSEHNKKLIDRIPSVFQDVEKVLPAGMTRIQAVTGSGTVFGDQKNIPEITDGTSNTAVLVEAKEATVWTQPNDLPIQDEFAAKLHQTLKNRKVVAIADGRIQGFPPLTDGEYRDLFGYDDGTVEMPQSFDVQLSTPVAQQVIAATSPLLTSNNPLTRSAAALVNSVYLGEVEPSRLIEMLTSDSHELVRIALSKLLGGNDEYAASNSHPMKDVLYGWHYHLDTHGKLPTNIATKNGTPGLSWRVRILPFVGAATLYEEFHLDEPWDSEHNKALIGKVPLVYRDQRGDIPSGTTRIRAVTGPGTVFGDEVTFGKVLDGTSNTATLVEANDPVIWTKPEDLAVEAEFGKQLYSSQSPIYGKFNVFGFLDGTVRGFEEQNDLFYSSLFLYADNGPLEFPETRSPIVNGFLKLRRGGQATGAIDSSSNDAELLSSIIRLMDHPDPFVRTGAVRVYLDSIESVFDPSVVQKRMQDSNPEIHRLMISELGALPSERIVKLLFDLQGGDEALVDEILRGSLRNVAASGLVEFLTNEDDRIQHRALKVIGSTGNRSHLDALSALLQEPNVSAAAKQAIDRIEQAYPEPMTDEKKQQRASKFEQRNKLWNQSQQLIKEEKFPEAFKLVREMLSIERQIYGDLHKEVSDTIGWLNRQYAANGTIAEKLSNLKLRAEIEEKKHGGDHPVARNALADYRAAEELAGLDPDQVQRYRETMTLEQEAVKLFNDKKVGEAVDSLQKSVAIRRELFGNDSINFIAQIRTLRGWLYQAEQVKQARDAGAETVRITTLLLGADAPTTLLDRSELAYLELFAGNADTAFEQLLAIQQLPIDRSNAQLLEMMGRDARFVALQFLKRGKVEQATEFFRKSLELHDLNRKTQDAGEVCDLLADKQETLNRSAGYAWRSESIWRYQKENPYQGFWANYPALSDSMHEAGKYHLELTLRKALVDVLKAGVNEKKVNLLIYAKALTSLVGTYITLGDFVLAEEVLNECTRIVGDYRDDPFVIDLLTHQADVRAYLNDNAAAEKLLQEAASLSQKEAEQFLVKAPAALRRLAEFYSQQGNQERALELLVAAQAKQTEKQPAESLRLSATLARVYQRSSETGESKRVATDATTQLRAANLRSGEHGQLLSDFGELWLMLGDAAKAEELAVLAQEKIESAFGNESLKFSQALELTARTRLALNQPAEAMQNAKEALNVTRQTVEQSAYLLSPRQQMAFGKTMRSTLDLYLSIASSDQAAATECFEEIFQWKGSGLVRQRAVHALADEEGVAPFYEQLDGITRQLSNISRQSDNRIAGGEDSEEDQDAKELRAQLENIAALSQVKDLLESQLSTTRLAYMDLGNAPTVSDFVDSLPNDGMFVDYFVFERLRSGDASTSNRSLLASVIGSDGSITIHDLGEMKEIDAAIDTWRASFGTSTEAEQAGALLRSRLWDPLSERLAETETVLISPDASLGQIPFHALPSKDGKAYLIEEYRLAVIAVPQLVPELLDREKAAETGQLLLVGDVAYDSANDSAGAQNEGGELNPKSDLNLSIRGGESFNSLPGTRDEIAVISKLFASTYATEREPLLLSQNAATETAFRSASVDASDIHVATHGFFAPPEKSATGSTESLQDFNPGLLSGLAFAGANDAQHAGGDDGVLTADEISTLKMGGVRLAVLSACETGLGRVAGGEGLIGIQRSFQVAGVGATIASFWNVEDRATMVLMTRFYRNLWEKKMSKLDSLREAQIWMLNNPDKVWDAETYATLRGDGRRKPVVQQNEKRRLSPEFWAAFSLSGDWR